MPRCRTSAYLDLIHDEKFVKSRFDDWLKCVTRDPLTELHADPQGEKPDDKGTPSGAETGHSASPQSCKSSKSAIQDQEL